MANVRRFLLAAVVVGVGISAASTAAWSAFPDRPIRFILSHPPGGSADVIARLMQPKLEKILGQPLIIENRAGAGGIIAMDALSKSKPDGYTIGMGASGSLATSPALGETVPYDPLKSFQPIAAVSGQPFMLAVPGDSPLNTLCDVLFNGRVRAIARYETASSASRHTAVARGKVALARHHVSKTPDQLDLEDVDGRGYARLIIYIGVQTIFDRW